MEIWPLHMRLISDFPHQTILTLCVTHLGGTGQEDIPSPSHAFKIN